jgi:glycine oxidase
MEDYWADAVVLATGLGSIGTTPFPHRVYPVKGQMLAVEHHAAHRLLHRPVRIRHKALGNGYLVPKTDRIIIGSTSEEMGTDARLTAGGLLDILRRAYTAFPGLYELPVTETWTGLRPATLDRQPFLHQEPTAPVWWLNGLYRHGILLGPEMGKRAAEAVLNRKINL